MIIHDAMRTIMRAVARLMLAIALAFGSTTASSSAQLHLVDFEARNDTRPLNFQPRCNVSLSGIITTGDFEKVRAALIEFAQHPAVHATMLNRYRPGEEISWLQDGERTFALCLASEGGDLREALKISGLFHGWITVVEAGDTCLSACAILLLRAAERQGTIFEHSSGGGRFVHHSASVGFHAPYLEVPRQGDAQPKPEDYARAYRNVLSTARAVLFGVIGEDDAIANADGDKADPMRSFRNAQADSKIPLDVIMAFMTVPPDQAYRLTTLDRAARWGIEIYGWLPPTVLSERMLQTACLDVSQARCWDREARDDVEHGHCEANSMLRGDNLLLVPDWQQKLMARYAASKTTLWPRPGQRSDYTVHLYALKSRQTSTPASAVADTYCEVMATWRGARLVDLELYTFNGGDAQFNRAETYAVWSREKQSVADMVETRRKDFDATAQGLARGFFTRSTWHLRPWRMLPGGTTLTALDQSPWAAFETGGNVFDKAPALDAR